MEVRIPLDPRLRRVCGDSGQARVREAPSIHVEMHGGVVTVKLVWKPSVGAEGSQRRWLVRPRCGARTRGPLPPI